MDATAETRHIRQLIADNQNRAAAERLLAWFESRSPERQDAALGLLNRIAALESSMLRGLIGQADAELERNRITQALLDLSGQLNATGPVRSSTGRPLPRVWWLSAAAALLAVILFWVFSRSSGPTPPASFDLTVHLHGPGGESDVIREGKVKLVLGDHHLPPRDLDSEGRAVFDKIPGEFFDRPVHLIPVALHYQVAGQSARSAAESRSITFQMQPLPDTTLARGVVFLPGADSRPAKGARLDFNLGQARGTTDENGFFNIPVPVAAGTTVKLLIEHEGRSRYNRDVTLSAGTPLQITLNR